MTAASFTFLALSLCLFCISLAYAIPTSRIWGGVDVSTGDAPWVVSVRVESAHKCVGSIIGTKFILTAGHCVSLIATAPIKTSLVTVRVGSINQFAGGEIIGVDNINIQPGYGSFLNDLAILTLSRSLAWTDKIAAIPIATAESDAPAGTTVTVDGWGLQEENQSPYKLQHLETKIIERDECEYSVGYGYEQVLCLLSDVRKGICKGDAGAGVVANGKLVGVAAFAFGGCGTGYPDVSTKVSYFASWINGVIA